MTIEEAKAILSIALSLRSHIKGKGCLNNTKCLSAYPSSCYMPKDIIHRAGISNVNILYI